MKKILFVLLVLLTLVSCHNRPIIGDTYVVREVYGYGNADYKYKYTVNIESTDPDASKYTFDGNKFTFYTNKLYTVGDTITIR